ncbi:hypothetical protein LPB03_12060 [Polaribacter vadi]|uniref:Uncharacterized protein n=1 Tax=Polaribacter vadi TaxID=1774273 RepID=A0A1B8TT90_9FLAO|nr:DUF255 domain-containing protein [Polaribacter vadi]AOW18141.1 hypothetical protein LPB03_12060 [Polaribacter vadi]OBY62870.1 hypothetical protein LPB3_12075 [Polaribacter vadi]
MNPNVSSAGMVTNSFNNINKPQNPENTKIENNVCQNLFPQKIFLQNGLEGYYNIKDAKKIAKMQNKPIFIRFTNIRSKNCKKMNAKICKDIRVLEVLNKYYVVVVLCVSNKEKLSKKEWYNSKYDGKLIRSVGQQNADYQITQYFNNIQPFHVLTDANDTLLAPPKGFDLDVNNFISFLENGAKTFIKANIKVLEEVLE